MGSMLFAKYGALTENEGFQKDIKRLVELPVDALLNLAPFALEYMNAPSSHEESKICEQASEKLGVDAWSLERSLDVSSFLLKQFTKFGKASLDKPKDIAADLEKLVPLSNEKKNGLIALLEELRRLSKEQGEVAIARRRVAQACLPVLQGVAMVVDYRVVFDKPFEVHDNVDSYSPEVLGAMPMGIIKLEFSEGAPFESVAFQADERTITILMNNLVALQKQMVVARSSLGFEEGKNG